MNGLAEDQEKYKEEWRAYRRLRRHSRNPFIDYLNWQRHSRTLDLVRWMSPSESCRILDLGCGDGAFSRVLALQGIVLGVDISREELAKARIHCAQQTSEGRLALIQADLRALPLRDACADMIVATSVLEHLNAEDLEQVCRSLVNLLKPHGVLVVGFPLEGALERAMVRFLWPEVEWCSDPRLLGTEAFFKHPATHKSNYKAIRENLSTNYTCGKKTKLPATCLPDILCFYEICCLVKKQAV